MGPIRTSIPLLSIITVVRNGESDIEATLASICRFQGDDVEVIVVDGASTDSTLEIARGFGDRIDVLVSEPDKGIYDAMNKGIGLANGRFVVHINVGDRLLRIPRAELIGVAESIAAVSFPVHFAEGGKHVPFFNWRRKTFNGLHHQGTFYRRGPALRYDTNFRTFADYDLNLRLLDPSNVACLPEAVACHARDGVSNQRGRFAEFYAVVLRNSGWGWVAAAWFLFKVRGLQWRLKTLFRS